MLLSFKELADEVVTIIISILQLGCVGFCLKDVTVVALSGGKFKDMLKIIVRCLLVCLLLVLFPKFFNIELFNF